MHRWLIVVAGTALQLCLGSVYAWSYLQKPLMNAYGWTNAQVTWAFSLAICCLGLAAAVGGVQLPRFGPRKLAIVGGVLFGTGYLVASLALAWKSIPLLYLGYGVLGGIGLGLGYVTPVATVAKWFPDKKGLATGTVIMGFGFGALVMSKVVLPGLIGIFDGNLVPVFAWLGAGFLVATPALGALLVNPPAGFSPGAAAASNPGQAATFAPDSGIRRFAAMWIVFFSSILAGISLISFQSPLMQSVLHAQSPELSTERLAAYGATLIAVSSIFNGIGRMFWGALSDRIGRTVAFRTMLGSQIVVFVLLPRVSNPWVFAAAVCFVLLCYGGGFGTMPSFVLDVFGARRMPACYGAILTAWSTAGIVGPQAVALLNDRYSQNASQYAFLLTAAALAVGLASTVALRDRE
jgi:OFA family oxalate/formate antiporter-like MFS transporter